MSLNAELGKQIRGAAAGEMIDREASVSPGELKSSGVKRELNIALWWWITLALMTLHHLSSVRSRLLHGALALMDA